MPNQPVQLYQGELWGEFFFFNSKVQVKGPVDRNYTLAMSGRGGAAWFKHPGTRSRFRGGDQKKEVHL